MNFTIKNYDVSIKVSNMYKWNSFRVLKRSYGPHILFSKFSINIVNWTIEDLEVCGECNSVEIRKYPHNGECYSYCPDCGEVDGKIKLVNLHEFNKLEEAS